MTTRRRPNRISHGRRRRWFHRPSWPVSLLLILGSFSLPMRTAALPADPGPILYGLDPILRTTSDPRLLGVERSIVRERLLAQGVDPAREARRPDLSTTFQAHIVKRHDLNLRRETVVVEANGLLGLYTELRYPDWFYLFPSQRRLPGGFSYYPPRPVEAPEIELFVDDLQAALERNWAVKTKLRRLEALDVAGGGKLASRDAGLLNLTIPIKLPRTLEKIIGSGEKTQISITGRESISIRGETTRSNQFRPNEFQQSQSWFPDLDMEQRLQVSLSGQIGEKIFIQVDHNSEQIGPEATKIKLSYQGDEDEIIRSIETGDVGLTLPGGQLLGYSSNQSGLFGIKVTGQVGPADFTVVASKQKAESDSKSFNSRGGQLSEHIIPASGYINNRFFRLDLPPLVNDFHEDLGYPHPDRPGRFANQVIDPNSVRIYRLLGGVAPQTGDVQYVAAAIDSTGRWDAAEIDAIPLANWEHAWVWRRLATSFLRDTDDNIVAVDLRQQMLIDDVLAVTYDVIDRTTRELIYRVGEDPDNGEPRLLEIDGQAYYRMKLLKPAQRDYFTFQYVLRNIYPLGGTNIDSESFELRIEYASSSLNPDYHTTDITYLRAFGLDSENPQGQPGADGVVDKHRTVIFDLDNGLLKFPLDFPFPFAADSTIYQEYAAAGGQWQWEGTNLARDLVPDLYKWSTLPSDYSRYDKFRLVAVHAAASSVINLGASNIEERSETVTLDGQTLVRDVDYSIDYMFGTVELRGDAAGRLTPDSNIQVNYQYAPFFGGGQSSLVGFNLGYDLGRGSKLNTTWLYESNAIVGHKARLGEEPSRTLVGNLALNHTFRSQALTGFANFLARGRRDRESTLVVSGETAASIPNPNTKNRAYIEDFEGAASSDMVTLSRLGWYLASRPVLSEVVPDSTGGRQFAPQSRIDDIRWYIPPNRVLRRWLNPSLEGQERDETQPALELYLRQGSGWTEESWGGIMRGLSRTGLDLSKAQFLEFWVNDGQSDPNQRRGRLHIDFGLISEDLVWPRNSEGELVLGTWQREDLNQDGIFNATTEDNGLDAVIRGEGGEQTVVSPGRTYSAERTVAGYEGNYPFINNTAGNNYEDSEDLDSNTRHDLQNGYLSITVDLRRTEPLVDVAVDHPSEALSGTAWRKYRIRLSDVIEVNHSAIANLAAVRHLRIWYEDGEAGAPAVKTLQLSELAFLGSRWEREGIRKTSTEAILAEDDLGPEETFFIGEINNKDNPDYVPPFPVRTQNNIPEKESSLVLDFNNLGADHMVRIGRRVSARGDDYTRYDRLSWFWYSDNADVADLDIFFRVGADSTNYYEIGLRYTDLPDRVGWRAVELDLAELANLKNELRGDDGVIRTQIADAADGQIYRVQIVGQPDLRRVSRYYLGVANPTRRAVSGQIRFNDITLVGAKREIGLAHSAGLRLNMADVLKVDFDWNRRDAEFHGLNQTVGQGAVTENTSLSTNFKVDDFIPLAGFQIPVSLSRRETTSRPKYETNSDIEILDEARRDRFSSVEQRESFSLRLSRTRSNAAIPRYLLDPWSLQLSGSTTNRSTPTEVSDQTTLQGSVNYNLRITSQPTLGILPGLDEVPLLGSIVIVPARFEGSASFTNTERASMRRDLDGTEYAPVESRTKPGTLSSGLEYRPLSLVTANYKNRSERDLLRRKEVGGINIGEEDRFSQDLTLTFTVPRPTSVPATAFFAPLRMALRGLNSLRPSVTYQGAFLDHHGPGVAQIGDPPNVRNISNSNDWQLRAQFPLGSIFKDLVPERRRSEEQQQRMIQEQQRLMQQARRDTSRQFDPSRIPGWETMTPDQQLQAEQEWLLEQAEERLREEGSREPAPEGQRRLGPRDLIEPFCSLLRGFDPVSMSLVRSRTSGFSRYTGDVPGWPYRFGFDTEPELDEDLYAALRLTENQRFDLSTKTRMTKDISLDVKYALNTSTQKTQDSQSWNLTQDWPDLRLGVTGLEKLKLFGGRADDRDAGWFRSSSFDVSYRHSKSVPNYTLSFYSPRRSTTITPRWSMTFHSGMALTLNGSISNENQVASGVITDTRRLQAGLQLQHEFQAQRFLAKLGLYQPGNQPTVNMSVDLRFSRNTTDREVPGATFAQAQQGNQNISLQPRFSYNINRNLSGAFSLNYSQTKNLATDLKTTTFGLGLEATFVF
ncbi:MAG: hypothetical protein RBT60_04665 [Candidatus Krumholzibacteria bacterium]|nr:hypothetical protein [Candidatus Krumholzibacteria bacterium]